VFPDPRLVAAIVDRVTFNDHIIETGTQSYRLRTSKTSRARPLGAEEYVMGHLRDRRWGGQSLGLGGSRVRLIRCGRATMDRSGASDWLLRCGPRRPS
jgi:hypothetical protein